MPIEPEQLPLPEPRPVHSPVGPPPENESPPPEETDGANDHILSIARCYWKAICLFAVIAVGISMLFERSRRFVQFWGDCFVAGWSFGDSVFAFLQTALGIVVAVVLVRRKIKHEVVWEGIALKLISLALLGSFLVSTVFVAPFIKFDETDSERGIATNNVANLSASISRREKKAEESQQGAPFKRIEESINRGMSQRDRDLLAVITNLPNSQQNLDLYSKLISTQPPPFQGVDEPYDKSKAKAAFDYFHEQRKLKALQEQEAARRIQQEQLSAVIPIATNWAPVVDYFVGRFYENLTKKAAKHGLRTTNNFKGAIATFLTDPHYGEIFVEGKHPTWTFRVYFRKENTERFLWLIGSPEAQFTCNISGKDFDFDVGGVPAKGSIETNTVIFAQAMNMLIHAQDEKAPLKATK
jgi:hypothetical protein